MSYRIEITCNEKEKISIVTLLEMDCPFRPRLDNCEDYEDCFKCINKNIKFNIIAPPIVLQEGEAFWKLWGGWVGNHDRRIDNAKCSKCGFEHPTVYRSLDNLYKYCPSCGSEMVIKEE